MTNPTPITVKSSELREGDVVLSHGGMRVLLDGPVNVSEPIEGHASGLPVYWQNGRVLNRADVDERIIPLSFTAQSDGQHRWQIQGNDLVRWQIEPREQASTPAEQMIETIRELSTAATAIERDSEVNVALIVDELSEPAYRLASLASEDLHAVGLTGLVEDWERDEELRSDVASALRAGAEGSTVNTARAFTAELRNLSARWSA